MFLEESDCTLTLTDNLEMKIGNMPLNIESLSDELRYIKRAGEKLNEPDKDGRLPIERTFMAWHASNRFLEGVQNRIHQETEQTKIDFYRDILNYARQINKTNVVLSAYLIKYGADLNLKSKKTPNFTGAVALAQFPKFRQQVAEYMLENFGMALTTKIEQQSVSHITVKNNNAIHQRNA